MKIIIADSYDAMSKQAANDVVTYLQAAQHSLFCVASGNSPIGLYKELINRHAQNQLDISDWFFLGLDEWIGMNETDEGSCRYMLNDQLIYPLQVKEDHACFFNGKAIDTEAECLRIEQFIKQHGGIQVAILGLGMNGHLGLNEPGTSPGIRSHVSVIDPLTQQTGQKYFTGHKSLTHGITLGLGTLMEAKHILLIVNGTHKASIVKKVIEDNVTEQIPATLLRDHPGLRIYLDEAAASLLESKHRQ